MTSQTPFSRQHRNDEKAALSFLPFPLNVDSHPPLDNSIFTFKLLDSEHFLFKTDCKGLIKYTQTLKMLILRILSYNLLQSTREEMGIYFHSRAILGLYMCHAGQIEVKYNNSKLKNRPSQAGCCPRAVCCPSCHRL